MLHSDFVRRMSENTFHDTDWDNLITFIEEQSVIPIVGKEMSLVADPDSGESLPYELWLARQLASKFPGTGYEPDWSLNRTVCAALRAGAKIPGILASLKRIMSQQTFEVPEGLRLLAEISDFNLYLTTSIDPLLEVALAGARPGAAPDLLSYGPKRRDDLPVAFELLQTPTVYHLFGRADTHTGAAVCEEDMVEWLAALQTPNHAPERLSAALETHHLLLIGLGFDGWLARFFLRAAKRRPLREERDHHEYLADPAALADGELVLFLRTMSRTTLLVEGVLNPLEFTRELHRRWKTARETGANFRSGPDRGPLLPQRFLPPEKEMPGGAVFISYSRTTDLEGAKRLKTACDAAGVVTWFDLENLAVGDAYEQRIRSNIQHCSYFVPIISKEALGRDEAFFYREWKWAVDRAEGMAGGALFILPFIIDDTDPQHPRIPPFFRQLDIFQSGADRSSKALVERLAGLLRKNEYVPV